MKIRLAINFLVIIICFVLQSTLLDYIKILGIKPDIMLIYVISAAFINGEYQGALYGFICGLLFDSLFSPFLGINIFTYSMLGFFSGLVCKNFYKENLFVIIIAVFAGTLLLNFVCYLTLALLQGDTNIFNYIKNIFLPSAMYNCVMALPIYAIAYFLNEYMGPDNIYGKRMF